MIPLMRMTISINIPDVDKRCEKELKFLMYVHLFAKMPIQNLCFISGIQPKQLYRAWKGESSYRSQQATALALIANLPYSVTDETIEYACKVIDLIAESFDTILQDDKEVYN